MVEGSKSPAHALGAARDRVDGDAGRWATREGAKYDIHTFQGLVGDMEVANYEESELVVRVAPWERLTWHSTLRADSNVSN